jgi:hypothetical protein
MDWTNPAGRKILLREGDITRIAVDAIAKTAAHTTNCIPRRRIAPSLSKLSGDESDLNPALNLEDR